MQIYDIIMIAVLVAAILFGAWKGLAWQVASLAAIFVSYFVALTFRAPVAAMIKTEEPWNKFIAMFGLFIVTSLGIWILFGFISRSIERFHLKDFDRHAGAVLGAVKGALLCLVITFFAVTLLSDAQKQAIVNSYSGHFIAKTIDKLDAVMPKEVHQVVQPYLEKLDKELDGNPSTNDSKTIPDDGLFGTTVKLPTFGQNSTPAPQSPKHNSVETPILDKLPVDLSKIDWRDIDWERAAKVISEQTKKNR